MVEITSGVSL